MIARWNRLGRSGAMAVEFGLTIMLLMTLIVAILQFGVVFIAWAGLKNGVGEAARFATLFPPRTDVQIVGELKAKSFGLQPANLSAPVITHGIAQGARYTEISVSYSAPLDLFLVPLPSVTLNETRRAYVP